MDSWRNRICQLSALSENLCQGPGLFCIDPGWSFQPKQPLQASLWMQMWAYAEQGIKGSISMLIFLQQLVAVSIFSFKSWAIGRVCQSTECRAERWALLVRCTQRQARIKMTGRLMTLCLVSRNPMVRATETRARRDVTLCQLTHLPWCQVASAWLSGTSCVRLYWPQGWGKWCCFSYSGQRLPGEFLHCEIVPRLSK